MYLPTRLCTRRVDSDEALRYFGSMVGEGLFFACDERTQLCLGWLSDSLPLFGGDSSDGLTYLAVANPKFGWRRGFIRLKGNKNCLSACTWQSLLFSNVWRAVVLALGPSKYFRFFVLFFKIIETNGSPYFN